MTNSGDAAEQVVRLSLEGFEVAAKLTGSAAKNIACFVLCCRCSSHLRKFYRSKETGTRIKIVYPFCHCQRCYNLRLGAYARFV